MHPLVGLELSGNTLTPLDDLAPGEGHLGRPVWNERRLLDDLELRLGLPRLRILPGLRVQQWSKRLAALASEAVAAAEGAPYYAQAYAVDPTGTAAQLLRLRDELVDAGWDGASLVGSQRLATLARLEALDGLELSAGQADRLASVEAELSRATGSPYVGLDVADDFVTWPGRWQRIFGRLRQLGARIEHTRPAWPAPSNDNDLARFQRALLGDGASAAGLPSGDGSLVLLRAATSSMLAEPTAALLAADQTLSTVVVRGLDPGPLDAALVRQGLPRQGLTQRSRWRPALQVLRLGISVAFVPRDPRRVLELLTLASGPFAGRPGRDLAAALCDRPGIGNAHWLEAKQELSAEQQSRVADWLETPRLEPAGAAREAVLEVAERAVDWLSRRAFVLPDEPSLESAANQARAFVDALRHDVRARLDRPAIEQLLQDLTEESSTASSAGEEAGRIAHVDSPARLLCQRERVVWWGFVGEPALARPLFRASEEAILRRAGLLLVDPIALLRARFQGFERAVHAAQRQLVLVIPEQVAGKRCEPHPLLDELMARMLHTDQSLDSLTTSPELLARGERLAARLVSVATEAVTPPALPTGRHQWHIDPTLIRARDSESASSLEKLLGCPLSWTLQYPAGLRTGSRGGLPPGPLFAGKLGHRVIEELHLAGQLIGSAGEVRAAAEVTFDRLLETEATGLLAPGASDERNQLRSELVEAAVALSALIGGAGLEVMGVEVPVQALFRGRPLGGSIDLLLRAANGDELVLDLKYGSKTYSDKLKEGHAIQLAVYAEARRQQAGTDTPPAAAYFSLKQKELMATDAAASFRRHARDGGPVSATWARTESTLDAIAEVMRGGRLPVAGVRAMAEAGFLRVLGIGSERAAEYVALPVEGTCKYCDFAAVCGRAWEQPW